MKSTFKWLGRILTALLALVVIALLGLYFLTESRLNQIYNIPADPIPIPSDAATIARGEHLVDTFGFCRECHGEKLEGKILADDPFTGRLTAPNLTNGAGGAGKALTNEDYVRALRHGVGPNGKPLIIMSSNLFTQLSDADLAAIIAFVKSVPPVDHPLPTTEVGFLGRFFILTDPTSLTAEIINHKAPHTNDPVPGVNAAYGKYLSTVCQMCHAEDLGGKAGEGGGLNLTTGGEVGKWSEQDFFNTLRTGVTPTGRHLDKEQMPWPSLGKLSDDELRAIWLYLRSLPAVQDRFPTPTIPH